MIPFKTRLFHVTVGVWITKKYRKEYNLSCVGSRCMNASSFASGAQNRQFSYIVRQGENQSYFEDTDYPLTLSNGYKSVVSHLKIVTILG